MSSLFSCLVIVSVTIIKYSKRIAILKGVTKNLVEKEERAV